MCIVDGPTQRNACRVFVWSGKCSSGMYLLGEMSFGHLSGRSIVRRRRVWSGKYSSGIFLVIRMSVGDVSGEGSVCRGCVWSGKRPSGMRLAGGVFIGDFSARESVLRGSTRPGSVRRGNIGRGCIRKLFRQLSINAVLLVVEFYFIISKLFFKSCYSKSEIYICFITDFILNICCIY